MCLIRRDRNARYCFAFFHFPTILKLVSALWMCLLEHFSGYSSIFHNVKRKLFFWMHYDWTDFFQGHLITRRYWPCVGAWTFGKMQWAVQWSLSNCPIKALIIIDSLSLTSDTTVINLMENNLFSARMYVHTQKPYHLDLFFLIHLFLQWMHKHNWWKAFFMG